jgi:hypothetical protein
MSKSWIEPRLDDLLSDPILDVLLAYDRLSRDDLRLAIERGRQALARGRRRGEVEPPDAAACDRRRRDIGVRGLEDCCA